MSASATCRATIGVWLSRRVAIRAVMTVVPPVWLTSTLLGCSGLRASAVTRCGNRAAVVVGGNTRPPGWRVLAR